MENELLLTKSNICRTCLLSYNEMCSIFDKISIEDNKEYIIDILEKFTSLQLSRKDNVPHFICKLCVQQLEQSFLFKQKCYNSIKKLESDLEKYRYLSNSENDLNNDAENNLSPTFSNYEDTNSSTYEPKHRCTICNKTFVTLEELEKHKNKHVDIKKLTCKVCGKIFSRFVSNSLLASHSRIHSGEKLYSCKFCDKSFTQSSGMNKHLKTHLNVKQYQCNYCPKLFSSSSYRNIHHRKHTGEKPLICNTCDKSFYDPKNFKQHQLIHTGHKPYLCISCGKTFRRNYHLTVHMKIHTNRPSTV
ncbi:oocyte zinc finger protein XlCOF10-like isoform X2 [Diorhabda carinulata]|uniref:oocyte zinc finger protein XlCOF10-like isoform X2 n=1 Tax=Diorhabda carinulata TaxID=1163345 RepID=UPI00259FFF6F|nr:oocyte zinc finger protein XlCOF10-like isoform X2 [Diorhabda carinulata]